VGVLKEGKLTSHIVGNETHDFRLSSEEDPRVHSSRFRTDKQDKLDN